MFLIKKERKLDQTVINDLVQTYFSCLKNGAYVLSGVEISELFRYSMCLVLGLSAKGFSTKIEIYSKRIIEVLEDVLDSHNVGSWAEDEKQGLLEACVHCMEMSRKRANV